MSEGFDSEVVDLLARSARTITQGTWVFAGFNWPMLATRTARVLGTGFTEVYEAGAACDRMPDRLPTSTTDYDAYRDQICWSGSTMDVLGLVPRLSAVYLDAARVDIHGAIATFGDGVSPGPRGRSAGGGGSADVAERASRLVLIHSSSRPDSIAASTALPTATPGPGTDVLILTRWGTLRGGLEPELLDLMGSKRAEEFREHVEKLGVKVAGVTAADPADVDERLAASRVLLEAGASGYRSGRRS